ncbi:MAG: hypothetical protein M0020_04840, partial [Actinomycetota bacterium]|nr:hypothetical protein [Actinomycetota bacterium]
HRAGFGDPRSGAGHSNDRSPWPILVHPPADRESSGDYFSGLLGNGELQRRAKELDARRANIDTQRHTLSDQRAELAVARHAE